MLDRGSECVCRCGNYVRYALRLFFFFFQAEDGIRDDLVTGVQTCALPIYHSPSLVPGNTPYVTTARDLATFLDQLDRYFDFFTGELGGEPATPDDIRDLALAWPGSRAARPAAQPLGRSAAV